MNFEDLALPIILTGILMLFIAERLAPRSKLPHIRGWTIRGLAVSAAAFGLSLYVPLLWDAALAEHTLLDASGLGLFGGAFVGVLFLELMNYGWHRVLHRNATLWRWSHQMHHSSERIDVASSFYFSPVDILGWAAVASFTLVFVLGISGPAALLATVVITLLNVFTHSNLRTPRWVGWFIARPEMHALHHERGVHGRNYAAIPLWDLVFGTYVNPQAAPERTGFYDGASARILDMLIGRDVSKSS